MHRCIAVVLMSAATAATVGVAPQGAGAVSVPSQARAAGDRHCPPSYVLLDKQPLVTSKGRRLGAAMLFSGQSGETEPPAPGFCFEVTLKPRYRKPLLPLRKKLTVTSPSIEGPAGVLGTVEPARRQFPIADHASFYGPGCTAVGKATMRVDGRKATVYVRGAL